MQRASQGEPVLARAPAGGVSAAANKKGKATGLTYQEQNWDRPALAGHAGDAYNAGDYGHAVSLYERLYELAADGSTALRIAQCYDRLTDPDQAKHWRNKAHGIDDTVPPVSAQQF